MIGAASLMLMTFPLVQQNFCPLFYLRRQSQNDSSGMQAQSDDKQEELPSGTQLSFPGVNLTFCTRWGMQYISRCEMSVIRQRIIHILLLPTRVRYNYGTTMTCPSLFCLARWCHAYLLQLPPRRCPPWTPRSTRRSTTERDATRATFTQKISQA